MSNLQNTLSSFNIYENDESCFFLEYNNMYFSITKFVYIFIKTVKEINSPDEDEIMNKLNLNSEEFEFICQDLEKQLENISIRKPKRTLFLQFPLIKSRDVNIITSLTMVFIPGRIYAFLLSLSLLLAIYIAFLLMVPNYEISASIDEMNLFYIYISIVLTSIFHEFGHASASKKFNKPPGDIGVGLFFIFPVFYSDVTRIWTLNRNKRIIVNLSGLYFQIIFCLIITILFIDNPTFIKSYLITNISIIAFSFIPFIKTDGYWVLSDLFDKKNLFENANNYLVHFIIGRRKFDWFYFVYSILHFFFLGYLLFIFFVNIYHQINLSFLDSFNFLHLLKLLFHLLISFFLIRSLLKKLVP